MNTKGLIGRLDRFGRAFAGIAGVVSDADARWKPPSGAWSVLEIARHLGDEEVEDFRARLRMTLEDPSAPWPRNDPEAWARERGYNEADLGEAVRRFVHERAESVRWLESLRGADWSRAYVHPKAGPISAADLLVSWSAHDALHMRQVAKRMYELAAREGEGLKVGVKYAGEWGA